MRSDRPENSAYFILSITGRWSAILTLLRKSEFEQMQLMSSDGQFPMVLPVVNCVTQVFCKNAQSVRDRADMKCRGQCGDNSPRSLEDLEVKFGHGQDLRGRGRMQER